MRASVEIREWSMDTRVPSFPGVYGAIVVPALRGNVNEPYLVTNESQFLSQFTPNESIGIGYDSSHYSASAFLVKSNKLWVVRAANNPKYGGCVLGQDIPVSTVGIYPTHGLNVFTFKHTLSSDLEKAESLLAYISTGEKVMLSVEGGDLPDGFNVSAVYYYIEYNADSFQFKLAYTKDDAENGIGIEFTDNGSGTLSLTLIGSGANESLTVGIKDPSSFILDSSDGKVAGLSSTFTVDVERDAFDVTSAFYNTIETGDQIQLTATTFPVVDLGNALAEGVTYYLIKVLGYQEVQLSRTLADAQVGTFIPISTIGENINGIVINKAVTDPLVTANNTTNSFTTTAEFFATAETGDLVNFDAVDPDTGFPTVTDGGTPIDNTNDFYIIKGTTNLQVARSVAEAESGIAVEFGTNGAGLSMSLMNKTVTTTMGADLSNDTLSVSPTFFEWIESGNKVRVTSSDTIPSGLSESVDYFVIKLEDNTIKLAQSSEAVLAEQAVDISNPGSGTHTIENFTNWELIGAERKCLFFYGANPGNWNNSIYIMTTHYPYGDEDSWSEDDQAAADLVKEPDCFLVYVYKKNPDKSLTLVEDAHLCSRIKGKKDGYGNNVYVEDALLKSNYIRAVDNDGVDSSVYPRNQTQILMLNGGDDGDQVTDTHMLQALEPIANKRNIMVTLLMDGGWATPAYQKQGLLSIAGNRKDCFAILSTPIASEQSSDYMNALLDYRKNQLNANTSYGGLFTAHLQIQDKFNSRKIYVPPDGYIGAAISETAGNYEIWYPPAGPRRGILKVLDCARRFTEGEEDVLYDNGINPIDFYPGKGIRIWGQKTLLSRPASLDRINVRLLLIVIEPAIAEYLEDFLFEFNDTITRAIAASGIESYMENIRSRRGVYAYRVVCSDENNSEVDIDANRMNVWLFVQPVKAAEEIKFTTIITPTGGSLSVG